MKFIYLFIYLARIKKNIRVSDGMFFERMKRVFKRTKWKNLKKIFLSKLSKFHEKIAKGNVICYLFSRAEKQRVRSRAGLPEESFV